LETAGPEAQRCVLNVGGNNKAIPIPGHFKNWKHDLLDIDPEVRPEVLLDARQLTSLTPAIYDAVYCSHNLEHFHSGDVPRVLKGFLHVLKPDGFAEIRVPDLQAVVEHWVKNGMDIEDVLYQSAAGPIMIKDVLYGLGWEIERRGQEFFSHKTGFTLKSLARVLVECGFHTVKLQRGFFELRAVAYRTSPGEAQLALVGLR
jgi:SAM-dependent methyltransferase